MEARISPASVAMPAGFRRKPSGAADDIRHFGLWFTLASEAFPVLFRHFQPLLHICARFVAMLYVNQPSFVMNV